MAMSLSGGNRVRLAGYLQPLDAHVGNRQRQA
jgi:hypothetical protein